MAIQRPKNAALIVIPTNLGASRTHEYAMGDPVVTQAIAQVLMLTGPKVEETVTIPVSSPNFSDRSNAKNLPKIVDLTTTVRDQIVRLRNENRDIVVIGGDHSLSCATVPAIAETIDGDLGVVIIDRHLDYNTPSTSPSGNVHGMPVAWYTGAAGFPDVPGKAKVKPENVLIIGINDPDKNEEHPEQGELERAAAAKIGVITMDEFKEQGRDMDLICKKITDLRKRVGAVYFSIDIDGVDVRDFDATLMPNFDGLRYTEVLEIAKNLANQDPENTLAPVVGVEVVELSAHKVSTASKTMLFAGLLVTEALKKPAA